MIVVDVTPSIYQDADALVGSRYETFDQLVNVALRNQIALETKGSPDALVASALSNAPVRVRARDSQRASQRAAAAIARDSSDADWRRLARRIEAPLEPAGRAEIIDDGVLWGQVNRLLPTALGIRVLANQLVERGQTAIAVSDWHQTAGLVATSWKAELEAKDLYAGRKRPDLWATAFPSEDRGSQRRYISQFLGAPGQPRSMGGVEMLGLVIFGEAEREGVVGLSPAGIQWADIENPIFDGTEPTATFSILEARFYLEHVQRYLPAEYAFTLRVAQLVEAGQDRSSLDASLASLYPRWTDFISTMRAGVLGRLHDLGLLLRIRKGQRVEYALSELAYDLDLVEPAAI